MSSLATRKGGSFSTDRVEALLALLKMRASKGGGFGAGASFLYRPGGVAGGNVFTTWPTLMAAVSATNGPKFIGVDSSILPATVTAGTWAVDECTFQGFNFFSELLFETGSFITGDYIALDTITFTNVGATSPYSPTAVSQLITRNSVIQSITGAAPWMHVTVSTVVSGVIMADFSFIGDGTNHAITIDAGQFLSTTLIGGSAIPPNTVAGAGTLGIEISPDSLIATPQAVATLNASTLGQNLAATTNVAPLGPAATIALATSSGIFRQRGGRLQVSGSISMLGVGVGAGTITINLLRDATIIATATLDPGTGGHAADTLTVIDTLSDFVAHSYTIQAVASVGTLTAAALQASISANEV
jgi:hypothetical protein